MHVDKAVCSGYPRTVQTGNLVLAERSLELEVNPGLQEIRHGIDEVSGGYDICADVAFSHWRATQEEATFCTKEALMICEAKGLLRLHGVRMHGCRISHKQIHRHVFQRRSKLRRGVV